MSWVHCCCLLNLLLYATLVYQFVHTECNHFVFVSTALHFFPSTLIESIIFMKFIR